MDSLSSPTNMMNTLSLQSDETFQNNLIEAMNPSVKRLSLADITVTEILETYKHDRDLLKHILAAKTQEDKRKSAEEFRKAEEARLQSKYIDLQLEQNRLSNDWLINHDLLSPSFLNNIPPSPYTLFDVEPNLSAPSPYTLFDIEPNLSAPSSPEPNHKGAQLIEKINLTDDPPPSPHSLSDGHESIIPPSLLPPKASCKRTFSRTKSTRKPSVRILAKKNRPSKTEEEEEPLDHDTVMEALRAKLKRSSQQPKEMKQEITNMSPSGILLLDLKNPKKSFPIRARAIVRKPNSFISAHKPKETNVHS